MASEITRFLGSDFRADACIYCSIHHLGRNIVFDLNEEGLRV